LALPILDCSTASRGDLRGSWSKKWKSSKSQTKQLFHTNPDRLPPLEICKPKQNKKKKKKKWPETPLKDHFSQNQLFIKNRPSIIERGKMKQKKHQPG
jgi:hypothetical protein